MRHKQFGLIAILLIVLLYVNIARAQVTGIEIDEYGRYKITAEGPQSGPYAVAGEYPARSGTHAEEVVATHPPGSGAYPEKTPCNLRGLAELLEKTENIAIEYHEAIGVHFKVEGSPSGATVTIRVVIKTPDLTSPGSPTTLVDYSELFRVNIGKPFIYCWQFNETWQMESGPYTIQLFYNNNMLAEKKFMVTTSQ